MVCGCYSQQMKQVSNRDIPNGQELSLTGQGRGETIRQTQLKQKDGKRQAITTQRNDPAKSRKAEKQKRIT